MTEKKHVKLKTFDLQEDGSLVITTSSYFDQLASTKEEVVKQIKTSRNNLLSDVISCLDVISSQQTKELHIVITSDDWNQPTRIVKQYTVKKENYNKR